eukprot:36228_1
MAFFSADTVTALIKLRDELANTLKCHYCQSVLHQPRTLNCPHHVCKHCANQQLMNEGSCRSCNCCYYKKEITNNICISNIVDTFHDLAKTIDKAANVMHITTNNTYTPIPNHDDHASSSSASDDPDQEHQNQTETTSNPWIKSTKISDRKRKRRMSMDEDTEFDADIEGEPKAKKRKISPEDEIIPEPAKEEDEYEIPSVICLTGYDAENTARFAEYISFLDMEFTKKWKAQETDILITKSDVMNHKPELTFKVLASILCGIPVVRESFVEDSYEAKKVVDYSKYVCNYRRVDQTQYGLFEGLNVLFATTNMPNGKLKILLELGKANILQTQEEIDDKDRSKMNERIMICAHETEGFQARQLSKEYNCRVISESWVIHCIYPNNQNNGSLCLSTFNADYVNYYELEPITERADWDEFDRTVCDDSQSQVSNN